MKKLTLILPILGLAATGLSSCNNANVIRVGATPTPHSEVLKSKIVQDYIANAGYKLKVVVYQDYKTPNKALNDGGIDANYFQHIPYLEGEVEEFGYKITAVAKVHCEPLSLYSKTPIEDFTNKTINIISDLTNLERALALLKSHEIIDTYTMDNFNTLHPENNYTSSKNVTIKCIDEGLLTNKVEDGGYAVIPGNFALTKWGVDKAVQYSLFSETAEQAGEKANIIAARTKDVGTTKINVLCDALAQPALADFFTANYGPAVLYSYVNLVN